MSSSTSSSVEAVLHRRMIHGKLGQVFDPPLYTIGDGTDSGLYRHIPPHRLQDSTDSISSFASDSLSKSIQLKSETSFICSA